MQNLKNEIDRRVESLFKEYRDYAYYKGVVEELETILIYLDRAATVLDDLSYDLKGGELAAAHIQDAIDLYEHAKKAHLHAVAFMNDAEDEGGDIQHQIDSIRDKA